MITGHIRQCALLDHLPAKLREGFELLRSGKFNDAEVGRHEIDGKDFFVVVSEYATKDPAEAPPETHRVYGEIQYVAKGAELMGWDTLGRGGDGFDVGVPYNPDNDCEFYSSCPSEVFLHIGEGMFAVFMPEDVHRPKISVRPEQPEKVRKILVKIRAELLR